MYPLKFNDTDLNANRQGYLSDAQRKRLDSDVETLRKYSRSMAWIFAVCIGVLIVATAVVEYNDVKGDMSIMLSPSNLMGFAGVITMFVFILVLMVGWNRWAVNRLERGEVTFAEGKARLISTYALVRGVRTPLHRVRLSQGWFRQFTLHFPTAESLRYFKHDREYRVYYVRYTMPYALSAEEIDEKDKRA